MNGLGMPTEFVSNHPEGSRALALFAICGLCLSPAPALAQEPTEDEPEPITFTITVTARKTEETLQETPISVAVFDTEDLEQRSLVDISQVADFAPNVEFDSTAPISGSSNAAAVFIRGVGQTDFTPGIDPGVGIYVDGVYLARTVGSVLNLLDVERMEILRGPQGTLFGKNTIGGAVNLVSVKPHPQFEARGDLTLGQGTRVDFNGYVNVPLSDRLFARASLSSLHRDGYVDRVLVGDRKGNINETVGRLAFRWLVTDNFIADFSVDVSDADEESAPSTLLSTDVRTPTSPLSLGDPGTIFAGQAYNVLIGAPGPGASTLFPFLPPLPADTQPYDRRWLRDNFFETNGTGPNGSRHNVLGTNVTLEWYLGGTTAKSITGYRELDTDFGRDPDASPLNLVHTLSSIDHRQMSQEFQFIGNSFQDRFHWISGLFYLNEQGNHSDIVTFADETFQIYASQGIPIGNFLFIDGPKSENEIDSFALFGEGTYDLTDRFSLTLGARWTTEDRRTVANYHQGGGAVCHQQPCRGELRQRKPPDDPPLSITNQPDELLHVLQGL